MCVCCGVVSCFVSAAVRTPRVAVLRTTHTGVCVVVLWCVCRGLETHHEPIGKEGRKAEVAFDFDSYMIRWAARGGVFVATCLGDFNMHSWVRRSGWLASASVERERIHNRCTHIL